MTNSWSKLNVIKNLNPGTTNVRITARWRVIPGRLTRISKGRAGVWGVNRHGHIYRLNSNGKLYSKSPKKSTMSSFIQFLRSILTYSQRMCPNFHGVCTQKFLFTQTNHITFWQTLLLGRSWTRISGNLVHISVGSEVWGINRHHHIYKYLGGNRWKRIPGGLTNVSLSASHDKLFNTNRQRINTAYNSLLYHLIIMNTQQITEQ